jgi:hypothetical protein
LYTEELEEIADEIEESAKQFERQTWQLYAQADNGVERGIE